jgi:hypothetical protein
MINLWPQFGSEGIRICHNFVELVALLFNLTQVLKIVVIVVVNDAYEKKGQFVISVSVSRYSLQNSFGVSPQTDESSVYVYLVYG